ncbi:Aste57867_263 [Aphanomyces stellatus]|uniref:Aste57867_263 protein n=1 Tax=Aphanomyces stellatus TaxID=120398 RepID=A0A485K6B3_9STRA|nr:hypothetical protein As57867_000263 [Aphanomyces stellatus]VFT77489.1 Aste57867_263 [Aphanomyces stellatus]
MTKKLVFERIRHFLDELFDDVSDDRIEFSALGDLFQDSHIRLQDSYVKTTVFNTLPLPFTLEVGYVGHIQIEGFLGVMTSGSTLRCTISDSLFVFKTKETNWNDELGLRHAHELAVALMHRLWNRYHIEGKGPQKNESTKTWLKKRVTAALHNMDIHIENTQVRVEVLVRLVDGRHHAWQRDDVSDSTTAVWGLTIPRISIFTTAVEGAVLIRRELPPQLLPREKHPLSSKAITVDGLQIYTTCGPMRPARVPAEWKAAFVGGWAGETHVPVLFPTDIKIKVDLEESPKLKLRAVDIHVNQVNTGLDMAQIDTLGRVLDHVDMHTRYTRYRKLRPSTLDQSAQDPLPLVLTSFNIFPQLSPHHAAAAAAPSTTTVGVARPFPARAMWKYAMRCVLHDRYPHRRDQDVLYLSVFIIEYTELYKRKMAQAPAYVEFVLRDLVAQHTKQHPSTPPTFPTYNPLTRIEQWKLSDLMYQLTPDRQLYCRALTDRIMRQEFIKLNTATAKATGPNPPLTRSMTSAPVTFRRRSLERLGTVHSLVKPETVWDQFNVEEVLFGPDAKLKIPTLASATTSHNPMEDIVAKCADKPVVNVDVGHIRFAFRHADATAPRTKVWEVNCQYFRGCIAASATPIYLLAEMRFGSIMASIVTPDKSENALVWDNIHDQDDGCVYAGLRYDPTNITSEWDWKGKVMTGAVKCDVSQDALAKVWHTLTTNATSDSSLSMAAISTGRYKKVFCKPVIKPAKAKQRQIRVHDWLDHVLQCTSTVEIQTNAISVVFTASTQQFLHVLATPTWVPLVGGIAVDSSEGTELQLPPARYAVSQDTATQIIVVDVLGHRVAFRNTRAGRAAAVQRLMHHLFPATD